MALQADTTELKREESASPSFSANTGVTTPSPTHENQFLDDVFGSSEPGSPVLGAATSNQVNGQSDAIVQPDHKESADVSRLRVIHSTSGYRDGLSVAREAAIQPGFDEGYSLGAALGLKAGLVVGSFESLRTAVKGLDNDKVKKQIDNLIKRCREQLSRSSLFSTEFIDMDGTWKWHAPADANLHGVAAAHPVVKEWLLRLDNVLHRLGVSNDKLEIRWTEAHENEQSTPKASSIPQARGKDDQSTQTFDF